MKKGICVLMFLLFTGIAALYGKKISHIIRQQPETKTVRFQVFAGTDYSSFPYKKSRAKVKLTICRFIDDRQETVWEGVIDEGSIKNYPSITNSIFREVAVHNVYDRSETLAAYYEVVYDYKGSKVSYQEGVSLSKGSATDSLRIPI